jgi:hypothetical protein
MGSLANKVMPNGDILQILKKLYIFSSLEVASP